MSTETHLSHEELGDIEQLPADEPRRRHLESCALCQARWRAYRRFVEPPADLPAGELREARERLHSALQAEIARATESRRTIALLPRRLSLRFAAAAAAGLIAVVGLWTALGPLREGSRPGALRDVAPTARALETKPPRLSGGGQLVLTWRSVPDADGYRVTVYAVGLTRLAERVLPTDTTLTLRLADLGAETRPGASLYWQVSATRAGEEIATSGPLPFELR